jgi:hypothetical protein
MSKEAEYRAFAASCIQTAHTTRDTLDKARLVAMAEAWVKLAERATGSLNGWSPELRTLHSRKSRGIMALRPPAGSAAAFAGAVR